MFQFGAGTLFGLPVGGNEDANPTPMQFGTLQDVSLDISGDVKQLFGQKQFPEAIARGKTKITGKAKFAMINAKHMGDLFFGQTVASGMIKIITDEVHSVPTTPFQVTIAPPSGTYLNDSTRGDLGVKYAATGIPFTKGTPATGVYSVNTATGVYTFVTGDVGTNNVLISYMYTPTTTGSKVAITNQLMGFGPVVQIVLKTLNAGTNGGEFSVVLYNCMVSKLTFATKQEDFIIPEMDFEAFANAAGNVIDMYSTE